MWTSSFQFIVLLKITVNNLFGSILMHFHLCFYEDYSSIVFLFLCRLTRSAARAYILQANDAKSNRNGNVLVAILGLHQVWVENGRVWMLIDWSVRLEWMQFLVANRVHPCRTPHSCSFFTRSAFRKTEVGSSIDFFFLLSHNSIFMSH